MFFGRKKKGMIDVRELVRQGKVRRDADALPDFNVNKDGFVDMGHPSNKSEAKVVVKKSTTGVGATGGSSGGGFMDFMNVGGSDSASSSGAVSSGDDGYSKREADAKIQKLDSVIYKLEQRIELLERKAGMNNSLGNSGVGAMGW